MLKSAQVIATYEPDVFCVCAAGEPRGGIFTGHPSRVKLWSPDGVLACALDTPTPGDVTCICTCPSHVTQFAVSMNTSVFYYDQRNISAPIHHFSFNRDEINQICINKKGEFLAACDDSGDIQVIDIDNARIFKTCRGGHDNICPTIAFHPKRSWELVSGGLDCQLVLWDFSRGKPLHRINMQDVAPRDPGAYLVNPAMVHSLSCMGGEPTLVCGLGSGAIAVCDISRKKQLEVVCETQLHSSGVGSIQCVPKQNGEEWWVVSGGNDSKLVLTQLKKQLGGDTKGAGPSSSSTGSERVKLETVHVTSHGSKINWICSVPSEASQDTNVVVADQTSNLTTFCIQ